MPLRLNGILNGVAYRKFPKQMSYNEGFSRDNFVYNYEPSKQRIYVEGFTDCWTVWQHGTKNVSAILGAIPSTNQYELMAQHKEIYLAYDLGDVAGIHGMLHTYFTLRSTLDLFVVPYKAKGKLDAGNTTKESWREGLKNVQPFALYLVHLQENEPRIFESFFKKYRKFKIYL